jgi:hypothetical protein
MPQSNRPPSLVVAAIYARAHSFKPLALDTRCHSDDEEARCNKGMAMSPSSARRPTPMRKKLPNDAGLRVVPGFRGARM